MNEIIIKMLERKQELENLVSVTKDKEVEMSCCGRSDGSWR